jgi:glycosyltransferase involved in cell wall biosynthesis
MKISVLITVKNDVNNIRRLIQSLKKVKGDFEVVVVDAYSDDGTYEVLYEEKESLNMIIDRLKGNRAVGRNRSIQLASGEKLAFLDSDSEVPEDWIERIISHKNEDIIAGRIIQKSDRKWADLGRVPIYLKGQDVTYPSNNLIYSKNVIDRIGLFDMRFHTAEDVDLNIRAVNAGFRIKYAEDVFIYHYPRENYISLMKQSYYDGIGRKILKKKYGLGSKLNLLNLRKHPVLETYRLFFGMMGYILGGFD